MSGAFEPSDVPSVVGLVHELAEYERAADKCTLTEDQLRSVLFGGPARAICPRGRLVRRSRWLRTVVLELLYLARGARYLPGGLLRQAGAPQAGLGPGAADKLARECNQRGYARLEWAVLDWNEPAIGFYTSVGAEAQEEWTVFRLSDAALTRLAETGGGS